MTINLARIYASSKTGNLMFNLSALKSPADLNAAAMSSMCVEKTNHEFEI